MIVLLGLWQGTGPMALFEKEISATETLWVISHSPGTATCRSRKERPRN